MQDSLLITQLPQDRWQEFKELTLLSMQDAPFAYGRSFDEESALTDEAWKIRLKSENRLYLFAEIDEKVVGMMGLEFYQTMKTKHIADLISVFIHPKFRKKGVASELLISILEAASKRGIEKIELTVVTTQEDALRLYTKHGFEESGYARHALKIDNSYYDEILMEYLFPVEIEAPF